MRKRIIRVCNKPVERDFRHPLHELVKLEMKATGATYKRAHATVTMRHELSKLS